MKFNQKLQKLIIIIGFTLSLCLVAQADRDDYGTLAPDTVIMNKTDRTIEMEVYRKHSIITKPAMNEGDKIEIQPNSVYSFSHFKYDGADTGCVSFRCRTNTGKLCNFCVSFGNKSKWVQPSPGWPTVQELANRWVKDYPYNRVVHMFELHSWSDLTREAYGFGLDELDNRFDFNTVMGDYVGKVWLQIYPKAKT